MPWIQIHFPATPKEAERLEPLLQGLGASAVTIMDAADQPLLEPLPGETPLWDQSIVTALFEADAHPDQLIGQLASQWQGDLPAYRIEKLADQDWERAWIDTFKPMRFGERIWIVPSWSEPPDPGAVNLRLDPGLAFGTGTHETTALCLAWLDQHPARDKRVLDYGCGSGVLALAALLDGASHALACDLDPQALLATRDNADTNGLGQRINTCLPDAMPGPEGGFDLVMANILADPLKQLAPLLAGHCRDGGQLVLSGILVEQAESVMAAYEETFELDPVAQRGDWVRLSGRRRQRPE